MAFTSIGFRTTNTTSSNAACEIIAPASYNMPTILEISITPVNGANCVFGLGVPATRGGNPTANVILDTDDFSFPNNTFQIATGWTVGPAAPTNFFRRTTWSNTVGSIWQWTFRNGLIITPNNSVVIWNLATNDVVDVSIAFDA